MALPRTALAALLLLPAPLLAQKLEKEHKKFLEDVKPIMLPQEEKTYRELKDKNDRAEFEKIFWARRDPDLGTPENEYKAEYDKARADADTRYRVAGQVGSATDCGRVFILLGAPDDVKKETAQEEATLVRRAPETWTFRDREGFKFKDGQIQISFDEECRLPQGARLGDQLNRLA